MLLAVCGHLAALHIKVRLLSAGTMRATPAVDVNHTIFSMLPAGSHRLAALRVEVCFLRTRAIPAETSHYHQQY